MDQERYNYDDTPRASHRPTLSEREPVSAERKATLDPKPRSGTSLTARSLGIAALAGAGVLIPRLIADFETVNELNQPWRFLVYAAGMIGWYGPLAAVSWWLDRRAKLAMPTSAS